VADLKADFADPSSQTVGTEFVGPSGTSQFPPMFLEPLTEALPDNPHVRFFDGRRNGYVRCSVDHKAWRSDYRVVSSVLEPAADIETMASFAVENGRPGAEQL
jgi:alkaline phosphatase D